MNNEGNVGSLERSFETLSLTRKDAGSIFNTSVLAGNTSAAAMAAYAIS